MAANFFKASQDTFFLKTANFLKSKMLKRQYTIAKCCINCCYENGTIKCLRRNRGSHNYCQLVIKFLFVIKGSAILKPLIHLLKITGFIQQLYGSLTKICRTKI